MVFVHNSYHQACADEHDEKHHGQTQCQRSKIGKSLFAVWGLPDVPSAETLDGAGKGDCEHTTEQAHKQTVLLMAPLTCHKHTGSACLHYMQNISIPPRRQLVVGGKMEQMWTIILDPSVHHRGVL